MSEVETRKRESEPEPEPEPESEPESYPFSDSDYEDERNRHISREEWAVYALEVKQSDGFKVTRTTRREIGQIIPKWFNPSNEDDECVVYAKLAIADFNKTDHKIDEGELVYDEILMATMSGCAGTMFYLTFNAKNLAKGGEIFTYQAVVWDRIQASAKLLSFRAKPSGSVKKWFFQKHQCGCSDSSDEEDGDKEDTDGDEDEDDEDVVDDVDTDEDDVDTDEDDHGDD